MQDFSLRVSQRLLLLQRIVMRGGLEMDASEPRVRRRGFFLHSDTTGEPDTGEHENPEGFIVRLRLRRSPARRVATRTVPAARFSGGRQAQTERSTDEGRLALRSGTVTGSHQRAHLPR